MFKWLNKQGVQSDKGYVVQRTDRFTSEYREGLKKITIHLENGIAPDGRYCEIIKSDSFLKWDDGSFIAEEKQAEILQNFKDAMEFQGMAVIVEG